MVLDGPNTQISCCGNCRHFDIPHPREPAIPCCQVRYDSKGYWLGVKYTDWCNLHKGKTK